MALAMSMSLISRNTRNTLARERGQSPPASADLMLLGRGTKGVRSTGSDRPYGPSFSCINMYMYMYMHM